MNKDLSKKYNFQVLKHFSKNIKQGAIQVACEATENDLYSVAFQHNKNKTLTIVLVNDNPKESKTVKLSIDELQQVPKYFNQIISQNQLLQYQDKGVIASTDEIILPPQSIVTLIGEESGIISATNKVTTPSLTHSAYFNQTQDQIIVHSNIQENTEITIRDINSKIVYSSNANFNNSNFSIDANYFSNGLYICEIHQHKFKLRIVR